MPWSHDSTELTQSVRIALHARQRMVFLAHGPLSRLAGVLAFPHVADAREVSVELLRSLTPLEGMKRENLHALAKKVTVKQMTAGRVLFKEGDADKRTIWIIKGLVEISRTRPHRRHDRGRQRRCARAAQPERAAQGHGARRRRRRLPRHRRRSARRHDHLGSDRQLRSRRAAGAVRRRQRTTATG